MAKLQVYVEAGDKRVFAAALDWPGWCRSAKDEQGALDTLVEYGSRYKKAARSPGRELHLPADVSELDVVQRLKGNATTDFGAPAMETKSDKAGLDDQQLKRHVRVLKACWATFDKTADDHTGAQLRKGPRGGGREVAAIVDHVFQAERAYAAAAGGKIATLKDTADPEEMAAFRKAILEMVTTRGRGDPPPRMPRSGKVWSLPFFLRRTAWHALDHAWEIEDRAL